jgi:hypothetical protein
LAEPVQPKDHPPKVISPSSSSSEEDVSQYKIVMRKRGTRPQNKFRLKSKVVYKPAITEKVIIIDEEPVKPMGKSSIRKKTPVTKPEKNKFKKGGLIINKKTITGKNKVPTRKQGKKDMKIPNPKIGSEGNEPKRMKT